METTFDLTERSGAAVTLVSAEPEFSSVSCAVYRSIQSIFTTLGSPRGRSPDGLTPCGSAQIEKERPKRLFCLPMIAER
jgi:hypothetical protein